MTKLAIVILNYNDSETTCNYINAISDYCLLDRIVIVDNCSTDESYTRIKNACSMDKISVIRTETNGGYAKGNNAGLRFLLEENEIYDYVIISNPDIIVDEDTIKKLIATIESNSDCFAVTGEVYTVTEKRIAGFRTKLPTLGNLFIESSVFLRKASWILFKYGRKYKDDNFDREGTLYKAESLPGCFFLANYKKFTELGFFDEQTFLYSEEDILFSKAKRKGYHSYVVPNTKIIHAEGTTIKKNLSGWKSRERIREQSNIIYMTSCLKTPKWLVLMYKAWNRLFFIGRFINMKLRTKYY